MIKTWNDVLALLLAVLVIPGLWIADGIGFISINGEVRGASLAAWTLIIQYYFRKAPNGVP